MRDELQIILDHIMAHEEHPDNTDLTLKDALFVIVIMVSALVATGLITGLVAI